MCRINWNEVDGEITFTFKSSLTSNEDQHRGQTFTHVSMCELLFEALS